MRVPLTHRLGAVAALGVAAVVLGGMTASGASPTPRTLFVNGSTVVSHGDHSCRSARYATIAAAVSAAAPGSKIIVCRGIYHEDVSVAKALTIKGVHATIDATSLNNGFTLLAPAAGTRVEGFTIENAVGEGVLALSTNHVSIVDNVIANNDMGLSQANTYAGCAGSGSDCGEGIHLKGTSNSKIVGNAIRANSGGVLLTDETGPAHGNVIAHNWVSDNTKDCGITLAGHNAAGAPGGTPNPAAAGVYGNLILDNVAEGNGVAGKGAGILMATGIPGGGGAVYNNTVSGNFVTGNGLAGVTIHNHVAGQDLNGNRIVDNVIATNNLDGDRDFSPAIDPSPTGVFVGSAGNPLTVTIEHNVIYANTNGIFLTGPIELKHIDSNVFFGDTTRIVGP